jgi:type II secretory pathway component PulF
VLFDLALLLDVGVAPLDALKRLREMRPEAVDALAVVQKELARGRGLARALRSAGFSSALETQLIDVAEHAGKLGDAMRLVTFGGERRKRRASTLRLRLWLPNTVAFLALAIAAVRAVTAGEAVSTAIFAALWQAGSIALLSQLLTSLAARDLSVWLSWGWRLGLHARSRFFRDYFEQAFFTLMTWQAEAGIDPQAGSKQLNKLLDAVPYQRTLAQYKRRVTAGESLADALLGANLMRPGELYEVVRVGEQAGRLAAALRRYMTEQDARLERTTDSLLTWLPRVYYAVVVLAGAATLL